MENMGIQVDCKRLIDKLYEESTGDSLTGAMLEDILKLSEKFNNYFFY